MNTLWQSGKMSDVVLRVGAIAKFKCHKSILAARSPVFAAMFEHEMEEKRQNRVDITDVTNGEVFKAFLQYIYTGKVEAIDKCDIELLALSDKYAVTSLKSLCEEWISSKLSPESVVDVLILADLHSANKLKSTCIEYIACYASSVVETKSWTAMIESKSKLISQVFHHIAKYPESKKRKSA